MAGRRCHRRSIRNAGYVEKWVTGLLSLGSADGLVSGHTDTTVPGITTSQCVLAVDEYLDRAWGALGVEVARLRYLKGASHVIPLLR